MELKIKLNNEEYTIEEARKMYIELDRLFGNNYSYGTIHVDNDGNICGCQRWSYPSYQGWID